MPVSIGGILAFGERLPSLGAALFQAYPVAGGLSQSIRDRRVEKTADEFRFTDLEVVP